MIMLPDSSKLDELQESLDQEENPELYELIDWLKEFSSWAQVALDDLDGDLDILKRKRTR